MSYDLLSFSPFYCSSSPYWFYVYNSSRASRPKLSIWEIIDWTLDARTILAVIPTLSTLWLPRDFKWWLDQICKRRFVSIRPLVVDWSRLQCTTRISMRGSGHLIVNSKAQPFLSTQIENCSRPTSDGSSNATVSLPVMMLGSTKEENIRSGVTLSNDCSSPYDKPACRPETFGDKISKSVHC